jgi:hypothetical protein
MKILIGGWFTLPRLGREEFSLLMRQGVRYDKSMGFRMDAETDLESAVRTIRAAVGEEIELTVRCFVCGKEACAGCPYLDVCDRRKVSSLCLCAEHGPETSVYGLYKKALADSIAS